jgi:hypothetical protein
VERRLKRNLAIGAAGIAVLGGGGAAYAVTKANDNPRQAFLGDVAKRLNVTPDQLNNALKGAFDDRLQAAVKAGKLTQAQADAIKKKVQAAGGGVPFIGPGVAGAAGGPKGRFFHRGGPLVGPAIVGGPIKDGVSAASKYLGMTNQQLLKQLRSGKSLAQIAGDQKKSVDGLKSAITAAVKSDLDKAVANKKITSAQESKILSGLNTRLSDLVNRKGLLVGPPGFRKGHHAWGATKRGAAPKNGSFAPPPGAPAPPPGVPII